MSDVIIIEMDAVTVSGSTAHIRDLVDVSLVLQGGELLVVTPERHAETVSLNDVLSGLIAPDRGEVRFMGKNWRRMGLFAESAARGRIGRVFEVEGWVSNLDMYENISLSQRHHTTRPDRALRKAIGESFDRVGLRDFLGERPHMLSRSERRRAQWVRAFLGKPDLLLLNAPMLDVQPAEQPPLFEWIEEARRGGAGVVWQSRQELSWKGQPGFADARCCEMKDGRLSDIEPNGTGERESNA